MKHTIRLANGGTRTLEPYGRAKAINLYCSECGNWQREETLDCLETLCPLHPYRKWTSLATISDQEWKRLRETTPSAPFRKKALINAQAPPDEG